MTSAPEGKVRIRRRRRSRRPLVFASGAGLALALTTAFSVASFSGVDIAGAAVARAESIADLLAKRSPGNRTEAHLNKTKHKHYRVLAEREAAPAVPAPLLAMAPTAALPDVALPAIPEFVTLAQSAPVFPAIFAPIPVGGIFAPGGGGGTLPGAPGGPGGPGGPPQQPPPPGPPTETPPAVPEPATWAMMILGFGLIGLTARRQRRSVLAR